MLVIFMLLLDLNEPCEEINGPIWPVKRCDLGLWCDGGRCIKEWSK